MRRSGRLSRELEAAMGAAAEELLRKACTDGEFIDAINAAAEEGNYRLLARVARKGGNEFPRSAREEAARLTNEAIKKAIEYSSLGSETGNILELAEIMDAKWIPSALRVEAFLGLQTLLESESAAVMAHLERGDFSREMRENYREFVGQKKAERTPVEKPPSGKIRR